MFLQSVETESQQSVTLDNEEENVSPRFIERGQIIHINKEASIFYRVKGGQSLVTICHFIPQRLSGSLKMQRMATGQR